MRNFPEAQTASFLRAAHVGSYSAGQYLWRQGQPSDALCLVLSGSISLELSIPAQGPLRIEVIPAGGAFGWSWLVPPHRWQFDIRAVDDVLIASFEGGFLRDQCDRDPVFGYALLKSLTPVLGHRLHVTHAKLLELYGVRGAG